VKIEFLVFGYLKNVHEGPNFFSNGPAELKNPYSAEQNPKERKRKESKESKNPKIFRLCNSKVYACTLNAHFKTLT